MSANSSDELFDIIQKELNKIVEHGQKLETSTGETKKVSTKQNLAKETKPNETDKLTTYPRIAAGEGMPVENVENVLLSNAQISEVDLKLNELSKKYKTTLEKDIADQAAALDSPRSKCIDADIQKMQMELQESYDVFQNISEKFEAIDFSRLQKRIKDLNLGTKRNVVGHARSDELKKAVDEGFEHNRLKNLTNEMRERFRKHPGEFGDIPELSSFFQACTQLEHGLASLKRQRNDFGDLEERMLRSAQISYNRVNFIRQQLAEEHNMEEDDDFELKRH